MIDTLLNSMIMDISDEFKGKIFKPARNITFNSLIRGIEYVVNDDFEVYILGLDFNGNVKEVKIKSFSIHFDCKGYKFIFKEDILNSNSNLEFHVSEDHSLVAYDNKNNKLTKKTPKGIMREKDRFCLVGHKNAFKVDLEPINDKLVKIPIDMFNIEYATDLTLYDFTLDEPDFINFFLSNGIAVVDTSVVYALHTDEAKQEALDKLLPSKQIIEPTNYGDYITSVDKNIVFGLVYGTKTAQELGLSYKAKTFNLNKKPESEEEFLDILRKKGTYSVYDYVIDPETNEKLTIGQYLVKLTLDKYQETKK